MPPKVIICDLCGGKFFRHSIEKHLKVCRERVGVQLHPCPYCGAGVPMLEMDSHIARCSQAKAAGAMPTGQSEALQRRLHRDKERQEKGIAPGDDNRALGGGNGDLPPEFAEDEDVRVECRVCGRKFNFDRIAKHQAICQKLANKKPREAFTVTRTYNEGGSKGAVIGVASNKISGKGRGRGAAVGLAAVPNPEPTKSNWREHCVNFREGMRAAREHPLPQWGGTSGTLERIPTRPLGKPTRPRGCAPSLRRSTGSRTPSPAPVRDDAQSTEKAVRSNRTRSPRPPADTSTSPAVDCAQQELTDPPKQRKAASCSPGRTARDVQTSEHVERSGSTLSPTPPTSSAARPNPCRPSPKRPAAQRVTSSQRQQRAATTSPAPTSRNSTAPPTKGSRRLSTPAGSALAAVRLSHR